MANYKGIKGVKTQSLASDPTASEAEGKLWYNTAGYALKYGAAGDGAWAAGGNMNMPYVASTCCFGTQSAGMAATGYRAPSPVPSQVNAETYNGTAWTEVNNVNNGRYGGGGSGTLTAGVIYGGVDNAAGSTWGKWTEEYDGTSFTEVNLMNGARQYFMSSTSTTVPTAFAVCGTPPIGTLMETYDGTSWSEVGNANTATQGGAGAGTNASGLKVAGSVSSCESWNGTSWTEAAANIGEAHGTQTSGCGASNTSAMCYGGTPYSGLTETWNGSTWTAVADMATPTGGRTGIGTTGSALAGGGWGPTTGPTSNGETEEWNDPVYSIKTVTVS